MQHKRGLSVGVAVIVKRGGVVDAALRESQERHDDQDRPADQQDLVPTALVGEQHGSGAGGQHGNHAYRS